MNASPLRGLRVLDLSRLLPGPYMTQLFSDLGAEVIKVELPQGGDFARSAPPQMGLGGLDAAVNAGKKSLALNFRHPRGREIFLALARTADVLVEGFRPGAPDRWGIGCADVQTVNPRLVYCSLSGYGQSGPYQQRGGHDLNYSAISGALSLNAPAGGAPIPYGLPIADLSGAMLAAVAVLAKLVERANSGSGGYLDMSLLDGVFSWVAPLAGSAFFSGQPVNLLGGGLGCYNIYETADGEYLTLAALEPNFWKTFCETANQPDLLPLQFDPGLGARLTDLFHTRTRAEWLTLFEGRDACLEPVNRLEGALTDPQVRARGLVHEQDGRPAAFNPPFVFAPRPRPSAPALGADTRALLHGICSDEEIETLAKNGIIAVTD